jgi:hypothetical protein
MKLWKIQHLHKKLAYLVWTTIVRVVQGEKNLDTLANLQPTSSVQIENLLSPTAEWVIWDFGGQDAFREEYLTSPEKYFDGLNLLIFVIDIQDIDRVDIALDYYIRCLDYGRQYTPEGEIKALVLLHKVDPDIAENPRVRANLQFLRDQVALLAKKYGISPMIRSSTIFDEKLQLYSEVAGAVEVEQPSSGNQFLDMIQSAKSFHQKLRQFQEEESSVENVEIRPLKTPQPLAQPKASLKEKKTQSQQTLKMLSLERKRIIEEFRALLNH